MNVIAWISIAVAVGAMIACVAHTRGRSFSRWWLYGSLLGVVALPHLLLARDLSSDRRWSPVRYGLPTRDHACPFCGTPVRDAALVCRHCRQAVDPDIRRSGWQPQGESAGPQRFDERYAAPKPASTGRPVVGAEWSMAGFTGVSPIPADTGSTQMHFRRRSPASPAQRAAVPPDAPATKGVAEAGEPQQKPAGPVGESGFAAEREAGPERPDAAPEHPDAAETFAPRPSPGERAGPRRADRRYRDSGMLPGPIAVAAIAVCVIATLFGTGAWRYGADIARLISPASSGESQMSSTSPDEASSLAGAPAATASNAAEPERASVDETGPADAAAGASADPVGSQPVSPDAPAQQSPAALATTMPSPPSPAAADVEAPSNPIPLRPDPPSKPTPQPDIDPSPPPDATGLARFDAAAPKAPPRRRFNAAEQASFDKVVERLEREMAATTAAANKRAAEPDTAISATGDVVYELQMKLKAKGFDPGSVDGQFGPQTRRALKAYQRDVGLPPTGTIDKQVLIAFELIS